jgi:hypothetical protein
MKLLANRTQEMALFQAILEGRDDRRILLIEAQSGYGKTGLMSRFADQCPRGTIAVRLDLKAAGGLGIAYVFYRIRRALESLRFPEYERAIGRLLHPHQGAAKVEIQDNDLSGDQSVIQVVLQGGSETERQFRLQQVQSAFFKDLRQCGSSLVFILDTFNGATEELQQWVAGSFLVEVADHSRFFAVVAGQVVPEPSIDWDRLHHKCCLSPIREHAAWYAYAQAMGYGFDQKELGILVDLFNGVPNSIGKALQDVMQNRQQA